MSEAEVANRNRLDAMMRENEVAKGIEKIAKVTRAVAMRRTTLSQYFSGPAGVGKTTTVTRILEEEKDNGGRNYITLGDSSPEYVLEIFQRAAFDDVIVVCDDAKIIKEKRKREMIQYAISPPDSRQPYMRGTLARGEEVYNFPMVTALFCTNTPSGALEDALTSRFQCIVDIPNDHDAIFWYTAHAAICGRLIGRLPKIDLTLKERRALLAEFAKNQHLLKDVSPRKLRHVAMLMRTLPDDWSDELSADPAGPKFGTYIPEAQRPELIV